MTFREILRTAVDRTPGAVGGAFAAADGELVEAYATKYDSHEWAVLTAHFGILLGHVESLLDTLHYGGAEYFISQHAKLEVVVHVVDAGYYALFAMTPAESPDAILETLGTIRETALALKKEMS